MDSLPVELIGVILSCVASARSVALASATCCKWRKAAKEHLQKLSFDDSDFCSSHGNWQTRPRESIIAEVLMRTTCLCALSIVVERRNEHWAAVPEFEATSVTAWLEHTRKTLKSLVFKNPIKPRINILDVLSGGESVLEYLEWGFAYIPSVDPTIHRLPSLVSLTVNGRGGSLPASNLEALLTVSPSLESLSLVDIHIGDSAPSSIVFKSSLLKSLFIANVSLIRIFLHTECLESLRLERVAFKQVKLVACRGQHSLRRLMLRSSSITELDLGKPDTIQEFHVYEYYDFKAQWAKYYHAISSSSNLEKLHLSGVSYRIWFDIGLDKIGSSFPRLNFLALNYQYALKAFKRGGSAKGLILESITTLEVESRIFNKQFVEWIAGFLKLCPNLKRLTITGTSRFGLSTQRMSAYYSRMALIMSQYPNVNIKNDIR